MIVIHSLLHMGEMIWCLGFAIKYSNPAFPPEERKIVEWENWDNETFLSYVGICSTIISLLMWMFENFQTKSWENENLKNV